MSTEYTFYCVLSHYFLLCTAVYGTLSMSYVQVDDDRGGGRVCGDQAVAVPG